MVMHPVGSDCANLLSGSNEVCLVWVLVRCVPSGLCSGLHKSHMSQAMGMCGILVRPWLTSLFHTAATCLAKCTSCSTKADRANEDSPAVAYCFVDGDPRESCPVE